MAKKVLNKEQVGDYLFLQEVELTGEDALGGRPLILKQLVNLNGDYVGGEEWAKLMLEYGINPELREPHHNVCSIGFSEKEQKWWAWSHRAYFAFGVGSETRLGNISFVPSNWEELEKAALLWHKSEFHTDLKPHRKEVDGEEAVVVTWTYPDSTPNEDLRGKEGRGVMYPPNPWGHGEWVAKTLEDARQMACDFAEGVS